MKARKTIRVEPGSELDRVLAEADVATLELERDGTRYRIDRIASDTTADIWAGYDPERAIAGMRAAAGSWNDVDAEALKAYLSRARDEGTRPPDRP